MEQRTSKYKPGAGGNYQELREKRRDNNNLHFLIESLKEPLLKRGIGEYLESENVTANDLRLLSAEQLWKLKEHVENYH